MPLLRTSSPVIIGLASRHQREQLAKGLLIEEGFPERACTPKSVYNADVQPRDVYNRPTTPYLFHALVNTTPRESRRLNSWRFEKGPDFVRRRQQQPVQHLDPRAKLARLVERSQRYSRSLTRRFDPEGPALLDGGPSLQEMHRRMRTPRGLADRHPAPGDDGRGPSYRSYFEGTSSDEDGGDFGVEASLKHFLGREWPAAADTGHGLDPPPEIVGEPTIGAQVGLAPGEALDAGNGAEEEEGAASGSGPEWEGGPEASGAGTAKYAPLATRRLDFREPSKRWHERPKRPKRPTPLQEHVKPKAVQALGSGFRKQRTAPPPKWMDHGRLLQEAQDSVEADVDAALKQAYRRQALQDKLRQYSYRFTGEVEGALSGAGRE